MPAGRRVLKTNPTPDRIGSETGFCRGKARTSGIGPKGNDMRKLQTVKSTIKNDPFASVIPDPSELEIPEVNKVTEQKPVMTRSPRLPHAINTDQKSVAANEPKTGKQKLTVHLASELADRVKNAAYWNPRLTIASIAEQGIKSVIEKFEREHGGKYPPREGELVGGRPIK